jgi:GTP-binding protein HflX
LRNGAWREGKVQVELAQLRYLLPISSSREQTSRCLGGGTGGRVPVEAKLETDRHRIRERINHWSARSRLPVTRQQAMRRVRQELSLSSWATNAGKSTLLNALTDSVVSTATRLLKLDTWVQAAFSAWP